MIKKETQRQRIIERRKALGMTQRDVADFGGISQASLSRIEAGQKEATAPELVGIAHATGATIGHLTGRSKTRDGVRFAARAQDDADVETAKEKILHIMEIDSDLDEALKGSQ